MLARKFPGWLLLLGALIAIAPLSMNMYIPAFPAMAAALHSSPRAIEHTLPMFLLGLSIGQLLYGPFSDKFGRRRPLFLGLLIYAVGSAGCAVADSVSALSFWRLLQALGGGAGLVIARAVIRDRLNVQESARAVSTLFLVMGVAPILAPLFGSALLLVTGWQAIFLVQVMFALGCMLWALRSMPETRPDHAIRSLRPRAVLGTYCTVLLDRSFIFPALCAAFAMSGMYAYIAASPFLLMNLYGVSAQQYALLFGINALGLIAASQLNGFLLRRRRPDQLIRISTFLPMVFSLTLFVVALQGLPSLPVLLILFFGYVSCLGAISPNTAAIAMGGQGMHAGSASALLGALTYSVGTLSAFAVSWIPAQGALPLAIVMLTCGAISLAFGMANVRYGRRLPTVAVLP